MAQKYRAIIFDLGGVLLSWDKTSVKTLSRTQFMAIMNSTAWHNLDKGLLSVKDACTHFGKMLGLEPLVVEDALTEAQVSLVANRQMTQLMHDLRAEDHDLKFYVMSNISKEHFDIVRNEVDLGWGAFAECFASGYEGMRKPDLNFFNHVIHKIGEDPRNVIFIDDTVENVCAARSIGIHGILMDQGIPDRELWNLIQPDSLLRASRFMKVNAQHHDSVIEGQSLRLRDNFAQLMIWELTGDEDIVYIRYPSGALHKSSRSAHDSRIQQADDDENGHANGHANNDGVKGGLWNYFCDEPVLTTKSFPPDADTTSTAYLSLPAKYLDRVADVDLVLDLMATNLDPDGIMQTYFTPDRPRTTPEVCCNMLRLFYRFNHGSDPRIKKTEDYVISCLENKACLYGNRHYSTPESFLYFVARLYNECGSCPLRERLDQVKGELLDRVGIDVNPLALGLRVAACQFVGMDPGLYEKDRAEFLSLQQADGGWPAGHFCCYGRSGARIGNRGLTTALALWILQPRQV